jgi:hypothetical protein
MDTTNSVKWTVASICTEKYDGSTVRGSTPSEVRHKAPVGCLRVKVPQKLKNFCELLVEETHKELRSLAVPLVKIDKLENSTLFRHIYGVLTVN